MVDPNGGILLASQCVAAVQAAFIAAGGVILRAQALQLTDVSGGARQSLRDGAGASFTREYGTVVVTAGPRTAKLLPQLAPLLSVQLIPVTYLRLKDEAASAAAVAAAAAGDAPPVYSVESGFPVLFNARLTDIYGLPSFEYPGLVKILIHDGVALEDPDHRDQHAQEHLPRLASTAPAINETSLYTLTPDHCELQLLVLLLVLLVLLLLALLLTLLL